MRLSGRHQDDVSWSGCSELILFSLCKDEKKPVFLGGEARGAGAQWQHLLTMYCKEQRTKKWEEILEQCVLR